MTENQQYRYVIRPNMLDETPYLIYGEDNTVHYGRNLGDQVIDEARQCKGYYIVHGGSRCKRRIIIFKREDDSYEGIVYCMLPKNKH